MNSTLCVLVEVINRKNSFCIRARWLLGTGVVHHFVVLLIFVNEFRVSRRKDSERSLVAVEGC